MESLEARKLRVKLLNKERNKLENRVRWFELVVIGKDKRKRLCIRLHDNYAAPLVPLVVDFITTDKDTETELNNTAYIYNMMKLMVDKLNSNL